MANYIPLYGLMAATGIIHIAVSLGDLAGNILLLLNGIGYFALIALHIITEDRGFGGSKHIYTVMIYTAITFIAYFLVWLPEDGISVLVDSPLGTVTKLIELVILFLLYRQLSKTKR